MSLILEAHRGLCTDYPENTLSAMRAAVKLGYGMIELDPRFSADNRCVIHHDSTVNRTGRHADGSPLTEKTPIASLTFDELRAMDFGVWFDERFAGERIPSLEEVLELAKSTGVPLKLDNVMWTHTPEQRRIMLDTIEHMDALNVVGFTLGNLENIHELLDRFPTAHVHFDGEASEENLAALSKLLPREQLTIWLRYHNSRTSWCKTPPLDRETADRVRPIATIGAWLLDKPEQLAEVTEIGVDFVETDGSLRP